ncbi:uncharacterized protein BO66DRAFT_209572 [Aspergillus aculeatinus CBS 121060]|uniref:Uncharacterized protein n=1 Tax=Aspergillus aculeatinus CBS 121060 TaxID=1448322 RepID=A0ACD1GW80_9EURO|nr:hypothetical protein BO66DRAFT_209572 [Aspergillus aculeatinus CBS 121060]RAH65576.1 hypothetical protein BO66DRAFT_209572 [Aspergillus aculeatinus CBS 121060]
MLCCMTRRSDPPGPCSNAAMQPNPCLILSVCCCCCCCCYFCCCYFCSGFSPIFLQLFIITAHWGQSCFPRQSSFFRSIPNSFLLSLVPGKWNLKLQDLVH